MASTPGYSWTVLNFPTPDLRPWGLFIQTAIRVDLGNRWQDGITYQPFNFTSLFGNDVDCVPSGLQTPIDAGMTEQTQAAFAIYDAITCTALTDPTEAFVRQMISDRRALLSYALASEFRTGTLRGGSSLAQASALTATTGVVAGISEIEEKMAQELKNTLGFIHMPPSLLVYAITNGTVNLRNGVYYSPAGHRVIADDGYQTTEAGTSTMWATGPIYYDLMGPVDRTPTAESVFDRTRNIIAAFEETYAIFMFDKTKVWSTVVTKA